MLNCPLRQIRCDLRRLKNRRAAASDNLSAYRGRPVDYAREVLGVALTPEIRDCFAALLAPPYRAIVDSAHSCGKTHGAAVFVNYWYDCFDPSVVITTAPTERDVVDLLWTEVRLQRQRARRRLPLDFTGPRAPEMRTSDEHYAKGFTARKGESFQGRHRKRMLFVFDEAEGIDANYWTTGKSMFVPDGESAWLCIGNPTTTTSQAYLQQSVVGDDGAPLWAVRSISALNHPNVAAALAGRPDPVPGAVTLGQLRDWIADWCDPVDAAEAAEGDFEFPSGSGRWHRPGPVGEARILGRRPTAGTYGVWSAALWARAEQPLGLPPPPRLPQIGCDVARFGDDWTVMHARWGDVSLGHEAHNGWPTTQTAGRLKALAGELAGLVNAARPRQAAPVRPEEVPVLVDDDGVGGGVVDQRGDFNFIAVRSGEAAREPDKYPNRRSELWFAAAGRARRGMLSVARLPREARARLKQQALAPSYKLDAQGRRVVERKDETKKKIGRSPDDVDALNLAYYEPPASAPAAYTPAPAAEHTRHRFAR